MKERNNKQLMKHFYETWWEESCAENPLIPQTSSRNNFIINGPASQEKKENKNIPLNLQKEIITVFLVMTLFLHAKRNWEMMTISRESSEK